MTRKTYWLKQGRGLQTSQPTLPLYPPEHEGPIVLLFYLNLKLPPPVPCITEKMLNSYSQVMFYFWTFADKEASCWWSMDLLDWLNIIFVSARRLSTSSVDIWCTFLMASRYSSILLLLVQVGKLKLFSSSLFGSHCAIHSQFSSFQLFSGQCKVPIVHEEKDQKEPLKTAITH